MPATAFPTNSRNEILWEVTRTLCPECRQVLDGQILMRDNRVYLRRRCPEHGRIEALIFGDANLYVDIARFNKPGTLPRQFGQEVRRGCPYDCGLCEEHQQHACLAVIEVNNVCNLECPICFANAGPKYAHGTGGFELSYAQVEVMIDAYIAAEGSPEVLQFSGGEPSLHPQILDFIALAQRKGIRYVMLNTNGLRIAHDPRFLEGLARLKPHVYLQFDGFRAETYRQIRGRADLLETKLKALGRLTEADLRVVLVAVIERGINEDEVGQIVEFGLRHPAVFGVTFHAAFHAQRHIRMDPLQRMTIPDIVQAIDNQTKGLISLKDFVPVPCCMPTCNFVTYALIQGDNVTPLPRLMPVEKYLDYLKNRTIPDLNDELLQGLERLWSASAKVGGLELSLDILRALGDVPLENSRAAERCPSCHSHLSIGRHATRDLGRHIFMLSIRDFMDPWTFTLKNAMKCCVNFMTTDGRMVPFCSYNTVGYRERELAYVLAQQAVALPLAAY